jgi:hypothetical protein
VQRRPPREGVVSRLPSYPKRDAVAPSFVLAGPSPTPARTDSLWLRPVRPR